MKVIESLKSINASPVPTAAVETIAVERGLNTADTVTAEVLGSQPYRLAKADLLLWLSEAPAVAQGGMNYSFTDEQRDAFRKAAQRIYADEGVTPPTNIVVYGYKGSRL